MPKEVKKYKCEEIGKLFNTKEKARISEEETKRKKKEKNELEL